MSRKQPEPQWISPPNQPAAAQNPTNEKFYNNGFLSSERLYDPGTNMYTTNSFSTPQQKQIEEMATGAIAGLLPQAQQAFDMSPEKMQQYKENFKAPQVRALNDSYNQALGSAVNAANARGALRSVGFENYRQNQVEKNRAQGLADIEANAELQAPNMARQAMGPYADIFNLYTAALSGEQGRGFQSLDPVMQGSAQGANLFGNLNQRYAPQLNPMFQQKRGFLGLF